MNIDKWLSQRSFTSESILSDVTARLTLFFLRLVDFRKGHSEGQGHIHVWDCKSLITLAIEYILESDNYLLIQKTSKQTHKNKRNNNKTKKQTKTKRNKNLCPNMRSLRHKAEKSVSLYKVSILLSKTFPEISRPGRNGVGERSARLLKTLECVLT